MLFVFFFLFFFTANVCAQQQATITQAISNAGDDEATSVTTGNGDVPHHAPSLQVNILPYIR